MVRARTGAALSAPHGVGDREAPGGFSRISHAAGRQSSPGSRGDLERAGRVYRAGRGGVRDFGSGASAGGNSRRGTGRRETGSADRAGAGRARRSGASVRAAQGKDEAGGERTGHGGGDREAPSPA